MSLELPYFKFIPFEWDNGNVQSLSREDKGLFIDICSLYWSRHGNLSEKLVINKLCECNANALHSLYESEIIFMRDEKICILFLEEQLNERRNKSETNSNNAKKAWEKRNKINNSVAASVENIEDNANAKRTLSECYANAMPDRDRDRDRDKVSLFSFILKENKEEKFNFRKNLVDYGFSEELINDWLIVRKNKKGSNTKTAYNKFISQVEKTTEMKPNDVLKLCVEKNWLSYEYEWIKNLNKKTNGNNTTAASVSDEQFVARIINRDSKIM